jgi:hypothetical protein
MKSRNWGVVVIVGVGITILVASMWLTGWFDNGCWQDIQCLFYDY